MRRKIREGGRLALYILGEEEGRGWRFFFDYRTLNKITMQFSNSGDCRVVGCNWRSYNFL